ncbi:hypothetical protein HK405_009264 [Cladochytrium tenue]|nr:hypothetical protein HK405_009264 [Cladochytrium tenue]
MAVICGSSTAVFVVLFLQVPRSVSAGSGSDGSNGGAQRTGPGQLDVWGTVTVTGAVVCIVTGLQQGGAGWGWGTGRAEAVLVAGAVLVGLFVWVEARVASQPLVPGAMFSNASVAALLVQSFSLGAVFGPAVYYAGLFFQVEYGSSATMAGLRLVPLMFGMIAAAIGTGIATSRTGHYVWFLHSSGILTAVGLVLLSLQGRDTAVALQVVYQLVLGVGIGLSMQVRVVAIQASVDLQHLGVASAATKFLNTMGSVVGIAVWGSVQTQVTSRLASGSAALQSELSLLSQQLNTALPGAGQVVALRAILSADSGAGAAAALAGLEDAAAGGFAVAARVAVAFAGLGLVAGLFVREYAVRQKKGGVPSVAAAGPGDVSMQPISTRQEHQDEVVAGGAECESEKRGFIRA